MDSSFFIRDPPIVKKRRKSNLIAIFFPSVAGFNVIWLLTDMTKIRQFISSFSFLIIFVEKLIDSSLINRLSTIVSIKPGYIEYFLNVNQWE